MDDFKRYKKLYEKGIITIEPFTLENERLISCLSLEPKREYELHDNNSLERIISKATKTETDKKNLTLCHS